MNADSRPTKTVDFNINENIYVQLTDVGRAELLRQHRELYASIGRPDEPMYPIREDADGWSKWQLWTLMSRLGHLCNMGCPPPFGIGIRIEQPDEPAATHPDTIRLDWLLHKVSGSEWRRLGAMYTSGCQRADVDAAMGFPETKGENNGT